MLGFLIGTACLIGLFKVVRGGRRWGHHGDAYGYRGGRRFFLRGLFSRLDTTPSQEKAIKSAIDDLRATAKKVRGDVKAARPELANAIRGESFDETIFGELSHTVDEAAQTMRRAVVDAIAKVHAVLDDRQKKILGDLIESGPSFVRGGGWGPYRGGC